MAKGIPKPSVSRWILDPQPPRERPRAVSEPPFWPPLRDGRRECCCHRRTTYPNRSGPARPCAAAADPTAAEMFHPAAIVENGRRRSATGRTAREDRASSPRCLASRTSRSTTRDAVATGLPVVRCEEALQTTTPNADHSARACEASSIISCGKFASSLLTGISLPQKCLLGFVRHCLAPEGHYPFSLGSIYGTISRNNSFGD